MTRDFNVIIEEDEEGIPVASVPELHGCHTQGRTLLLRKILSDCDLTIDDLLKPR
ncbi:MAG: type II toxin-antitoxin system HicB family antitoxin [Pyrinomonadaceae bacterium]